MIPVQCLIIPHIECVGEDNIKDLSSSSLHTDALFRSVILINDWIQSIKEFPKSETFGDYPYQCFAENYSFP